MTSPRLARAAELVGLSCVWCSVRTWDGVYREPTRLLRVAERIRDGDIVLLHEGDRPAPAMLPMILDLLKTRGLRAITVGELVGS